METAEVIEICRQGIYVLLVIGAPPILAALFVGLLISLFQALTQIQEATLTFVPKVVAMLVVLIFTLPFMFDRLKDYTETLQERIVHME
jgi:flagellar biosynthesis protein FliQ